ncbi:At2g23090 like protein [Globomyces pollinis-pini]|nr:At2g23090 like protein [Globomyces pollinis-pini]
MGNGAKAAMKRERNAAKGGDGGGKSQLKTNQSAMNVQCNVCRQPFLLTIKRKALEEHINSKHSGKEFTACFPNFKD